MIKCKYKQLKLGGACPCWYCEQPTGGTLNSPNGDEIWCCKACAFLHGKVKRFKKIGIEVTSKIKSIKFNQISFVNSEERAIKLSDVVPKQMQLRCEVEND